MHAPDPAALRFERLNAVRITAAPAAIDALNWPARAIPVRIAPDDLLVVDASLDTARLVLDHDPHAIVEPEPLFCGAWLDDDQFARLVERLEWPLPAHRPSMAQGMVAGLAVKIVQLTDRTLLIASVSVFHEIPDRLGPAVWEGDA